MIDLFLIAGGSGADGFSFHLSHRSHTSQWITRPDYIAYESTSVADGLSIQTNELEGYIAIVLHGYEVRACTILIYQSQRHVYQSQSLHVVHQVARQTGYVGGKDIAVSIDWDPLRIMIDVGSILSLTMFADDKSASCTGIATGVDAGKTCDFEIATDSSALCPTNGCVFIAASCGVSCGLWLTPTEGFVATFAARTGERTYTILIYQSQRHVYQSTILIYQSRGMYINLPF